MTSSDSAAEGEEPVPGQSAGEVDVAAAFAADLAERLGDEDAGPEAEPYVSSGEEQDLPAGEPVEPTDLADEGSQSIPLPDDTSAQDGPVAGTTGILYYASSVQYDELSRPIASKGSGLANSRNLSYAYNDDGQISTTTDATGRTTTLTYDPLGRVVQSRDPLAGLTKLAYDAGDQLVKVTDPRGKATTYSYDGLGQLLSVTSPDTGTTTFAYNGYGLRTSMTRADGQQTTYAYDGLGRPTSVTASGSQHVYAYDACTNGKGQACTLTSPNGSIQCAYTQQGLLASQIEAIGNSSHTQAFTYDGMGRLTGIGYTGGVSVGYG